MECRSSKLLARSGETSMKMRGMLLVVYYWTMMFFPLAVSQSTARYTEASITEKTEGAKLDSLRKSNADLRFVFAKPLERRVGGTNVADSIVKTEKGEVNDIEEITLEKEAENPELPQTFQVQDLHSTPEELDKLPCERVGFYRHPYDCTKFYHCSEYRSTKYNHSGPYAGFLYKCPDGLVYDEKRASCIWPSWSDPCQGSGELFPVPRKKFSCVTPGFQADPENCRWFYYCSDLGNGQLEAFEFLCPSDLLGYDQEKMLCNWKWTVPVCASYGSEPESEFGDVTTEANSLDDKSKALNLQGGFVVSTPITATRKPRRPKQIQHGNVTKNKAELISEPNISGVNETLQAVTELNNMKISHDVNDHNYKNNSVTIETIIKSLNSSVPSTKYEPLQLISTGKPRNYKQESEKKIGTAMWHRSWIDNRNNSRTFIPSSNNPEDNADRKTAYHENVFAEKSNLPSNQNNFGLLTDDKILTVSKDTIETDKFFKGKVRRISLNRVTTQNPNTHPENKSNINRGRNVERLPQSERKFNDQRYVLFGNVETKISNSDVEISPLPNPSPFINTRCSKLQNIDGNNEESSPLGCTSEVSLSIKVGKGRNPEKYILREDQIMRTSFLEKQRANLLNIFHEPNDEKNRLGYGDHSHFLGGRVSSQTSVDKTKEKSSTSSTGIREVPLGEFGTREETSISKEIEFELQEFAASSVTNSPNSYNIEKPNIRTNFNENTSNIQDLISKNDTIKVTTVPEEQTVNEMNQQVRQMPIHFYPQGVLLNIDLAYVNQIPPLVLLEVDDMLRKYMNNSDIDLNVLGHKLNASAMTMTGHEESHSKESEEVMHFIDVIENIINTSKETESAVTDAVETENSTLVETVTVNNLNAETIQENSTMPTKDISEKIVALNNSETDSLHNDTIILDSINKTENSDSPAHHPQNIENTGAFGRRRFFRKFRYPSIREQIERQTQHLKNKEVKSHLQRPRITSQLQRYTYPLSSNGATSLRIDDSSSKNSGDERLLVEQTTKSPLPLPFAFKETLVRQQENRKMTNFYFNNLQIQTSQPSDNDRSTTNLFTLPDEDIVRTNEHKDNINKFSHTNRFSQPAIVNEDSIYTLQFKDQTDTARNKYVDGISYAENVANNDTDTENYKQRFEKEYEDTEENRNEAGHVYNRPSVHETLSQNKARKDYQNPPALEYNQTLPNNEPSVSKIDRIQAYEHLSFDEILLQNGKRSDIQQHPVLKYGQRTSTTYQHKSSAHASISYRDISNFENGNDDGHNLHRIKEDSDHSRLDYSKESNNADDLRNNPFRLEDSSLENTQRLSKRNQHEQNIQTNQKQFRRTSSFDTTNNTRPRKRRKLRILVKKLPNNDQKLNYSKSLIEENISNNVLRTLKNKPLQVKGDEIELQIEYQDHVWNVPFVDSKTDLSPMICTRPGLFQHPKDNNMFYECFWDKWLQRFTLHVFSCPVRLVYDESVRGCSRPASDSQNSNLIK